MLAALLLPARAARAQSTAGPRLEQSTRSLRFERAGDRRTLVVTNRGDAVLRISSLQHPERERPQRLLRSARGCPGHPPGRSIDFTGHLPAAPSAGGPGAAPAELRGPAAGHRRRHACRSTHDPRSSGIHRRRRAAGQPGSAAAVAGSCSSRCWAFRWCCWSRPGASAGSARWPWPSRRCRLRWRCIWPGASIPAFTRASGNCGLQFVEHVPWIRALNVEYFLGVDGLSVTMVLLTALVSPDRRRRVLVHPGHPAPARLLLAVAAAAGGDDGRVRRPRLLPVLRLLGSDAAADVLPDRHLGRAAQGVRGDQVLPLHAGRLGADAAGDHRAVLRLAADHPGRRHAGRPTASIC